jgi:hypothetical protein
LGLRFGFNEHGSDPMLVESRNKNNLVGQAYPAPPQTAPALLLDIQTVVTGADPHPGPIYTAGFRIFEKQSLFRKPTDESKGLNTKLIPIIGVADPDPVLFWHLDPDPG